MIANFGIKVESGSLLAHTAEKRVEIFSHRQPPQISGYRIYLQDSDSSPVDSVSDWPCHTCPLWRDLAEEDDETSPRSGCWGPFRPDNQLPRRISIVEYETNKFPDQIRGNCGLHVILGKTSSISTIVGLSVTQSN